MAYLGRSEGRAQLSEFHSMHVPSPLRIAEHLWQDRPRERLPWGPSAHEMNSNSARHEGAPPITLKSSRLAGEILRELPPIVRHFRNSNSTSDGCPVYSRAGVDTGIGGRPL